MKDEINHPFEGMIEHAEHLRDNKMYDESIRECQSAVNWAVDNGLLKEELQARNILASIYMSKGDVQEMLSQLGTVISTARDNDMKYCDAYTESLFQYACYLTRLQPVPPQLFSTMEELIEVRSSMVDDENDSDLQSYRSMLDALKRVYKRKKSLRKTRRHTYTKIVGKVEE